MFMQVKHAEKQVLQDTEAKSDKSEYSPEEHTQALEFN